MAPPDWAAVVAGADGSVTSGASSNDGGAGAAEAGTAAAAAGAARQPPIHPSAHQSVERLEALRTVFVSTKTWGLNHGEEE